MKTSSTKARKEGNITLIFSILTCSFRVLSLRAKSKNLLYSLRYNHLSTGLRRHQKNINTLYTTTRLPDGKELRPLTLQVEYGSPQKI